MTNRNTKRMLVWLLCAALLVGALPGAAVAAGEVPPCESHTTHDDACGYEETGSCGHFCDLCVPTGFGTSGQTAPNSKSGDTEPTTPPSTPPSSGAVVGEGFSFEDGVLTVTTYDGATAWRKIGILGQIGTDNVFSVVLAENVTTIKADAFNYCRNLTEINLSNVTAIEDGVFFNCRSLALTELPDSLTTIAPSTFYGCTSLALTELPSGLTSIGEYAFNGCTDLALTELPSGLTSIEGSAFYNCTSLALTELPSGLTSIGEYAFNGCTSLALTKLPSNVESIGNSAFKGCTNLTALTLDHIAAPTLGTDVFKDTSDLLLLYVPAEATGYTKENNWPEDKIVYGAALTGLTASGGELSPAFHPGTEEYTLAVPFDVETVAFTPTAHGAGTVTVECANVASGSASAAVSLDNGAEKVISIIVKNSEADTRSYTITAQREAARAVNQAAIPGVTVPVQGAAPVTAITETEQYTGAVAWSPDPSGAFDVDTVYTATITLTPKPGYTLEGVAENFFTVDGADTVTNDADSGTVTVVFPKSDVAPVYAIAATPDSLDFGAATEGETAPAEMAVTVTNTGNQTVTLTQPTATGYDVGALSATSLAAGEKATFTVRPKAGLAVGSHGEKLTITPDNGLPIIIDLSFTVKEQSGGGGSSSSSSYSSRTLTDKTTGIVVKGNQIHGSAAVTVKAGELHSAGDAGCDLLRAAQTAGQVLGVWDVSLSHVFQGSVTVSLPVEGRDGQTLTVAHCAGGTLTLSDVKVEKGMAEVTVKELSPFAVLNDTYTQEELAVPVAGNPFADVKEADWFYEAVLYVYGAGLMNGTGETTFSPGEGTTRSMVAAILHRLEGFPSSSSEGGAFTDISADAYYAPAVVWCEAQSLVSGYGDGRFGPDDSVTREQLVTILYRYARYKGWDVTQRDGLTDSYADAEDVSVWAREAVEWAVGAGLLEGSGGMLNPNEGAGRAELAQMLMRLLEKYRDPAAPAA